MTAHAEHGQAAYRRRLDWGLAGTRALVADAGPGDVAVVVDVLSFTTTLSVALDRGIAVHPYPWATAEAPAYAAERGAVLARGRRAGLAEGGGVSLSPASFEGVSGIDAVVLPSPNGSAISFALRDAGLTVVGACLRNATAVGRWLAGIDNRVSVVAAGERWPDGSLRPAAEDLWGAGAVLHAMGSEAGGDASPESRVAVAAFGAVRSELGTVLVECASGRELVAAGFARDVEIAAAYDVSEVVPVLRGDAFVDAAEHPPRSPGTSSRGGRQRDEP
ncbi:MAG TPA: 2-phosphosulfolactate phosphatase [Nocardioides sp.]|nr:2-phosphosulfolactate phosphatase [Nocardioides sp.]